MHTLYTEVARAAKAAKRRSMQEIPWPPEVWQIPQAAAGPLVAIPPAASHVPVPVPSQPYAGGIKAVVFGVAVAALAT